MITRIILAVCVMGGLGALFGCLLAYASKKFAVAADPRVAAIREALPGANCGGCGYPGCDGYAAACVGENAPLNKCAPGGAPVAEKIAAIMGVSAAASEPMAAFVRCQGDASKTDKDCVYLGTPDCWSASVVPGKGAQACAFGCLGFGSCVKACQFGAIHVENGVARVGRDTCTGCGACVGACPRGLIALTPKRARVAVGCSNPHKGPLVKAVCAAGCIGCTLCVRTCPSGAISMNGSLAAIDPQKCTGCGLCAAKCPVKAIVNERVQKTA